MKKIKKGVPSAKSSRSVRGLGKDVSGKPYPRLCNARRPQLEPRTFQSQAVRLYRLHQARPSEKHRISDEKNNSILLKCRLYVPNVLLFDFQDLRAAYVWVPSYPCL